MCIRDRNKMEALNSTTQVIPFGQELNPETYATCRSDMILKGNTNSRIVLGNSFNEDGFKMCIRDRSFCSSIGIKGRGTCTKFENLKS